jgi:hypothetical protein
VQVSLLLLDHDFAGHFRVNTAEVAIDSRVGKDIGKLVVGIEAFALNVLSSLTISSVASILESLRWFDSLIACTSITCHHRKPAAGFLFPAKRKAVGCDKKFAPWE